MPQDLTQGDIDEGVAPKIYSQNYKEKIIIDGVSLIPLKNNVGEDGDLSELLKVSDNGDVEQIPGFKIAQINRTKLFPGTVKGWHVHFRQNDVWYVMPSSHLLVGLWDLRKTSPTKNANMRLALGGGNGHLIFIPKGVAHGAANVSGKKAEVLYFVDKKFDVDDPDEKRLPWNSLGDDFWTPKKD